MQVKTTWLREGRKDTHSYFYILHSCCNARTDSLAGSVAVWLHYWPCVAILCDIKVQITKSAFRCHLINTIFTPLPPRYISISGVISTLYGFTWILRICPCPHRTSPSCSRLHRWICTIAPVSCSSDHWSAPWWADFGGARPRREIISKVNRIQRRTEW